MIDINEITNEVQDFQDENTRQFLRVRDALMVKGDVDYPEPDYLLRAHDVRTLPTGNLIAISAKWKNGKTFLCDILCAIYLGCEVFDGMQGRNEQGKVQFFDTEQDMSDTARILQVINALTGKDNADRCEVYCLRGISVEGERETVSRYQFIVDAVRHTRPRLVVIDGIADLIYNYNDVIESQTMVNNLAALASENNCAIVVVMHQNKGKDDKNMKGHLGTMLYQKCSDVFQVQKVESFFAVHHAVSRHQSIGDFYFAIDDGVPTPYMSVDASRIVEENEKRERIVGNGSLTDRKIVRADFDDSDFVDSQELFGDPNVIGSGKLLRMIQQKFMCSVSMAYTIMQNSVQESTIMKLARKYKFLE